MNIKKILIVAAGVSLLAAGCSKTSTNQELSAVNQPAESKPQAVIAPELDPSQNWIRFYPGENLRFNLLFPTFWLGDEGGTDSHFVLRSRKGADGTNVDDVIMDFTISPMTAKTVTAQATADMKGSKDSSPVTTVKTDTGVPYAFATYIDKNNKPTLGVTVEYPTAQYIHIKVTGNVTHPYVGRMIQSIALTQ
jgi:hypothetical protein